MAADEATGHKFFIIDALDECDQESQQILMKQLQHDFQHKSFATDIRLIITSRPYREIQERLKVFSNKELASFPESKRDIHRFVGEKVAELAVRKQYTDRVKKRITDILEEKSESTFLWVGLGCEELDQVSSKNAVDHLEKMPSGLNALYKRLLDNALDAPGQNPKVVKQILGLVTVSFRPLTIPELSAVCQTYLDEDQETRIQFTRDDIATCRLLVIIQDEQVLLLHQSVKDFLAGDNAQQWVQEVSFHAHIAYKCVDQLICDFELIKDRPRWEKEFSSYASDYWDSHARLAGDVFEVKHTQAIFFEVKSPLRDTWLYRASDRYRVHVKLPRRASILHIAGYCGIPAILDYLRNSPNQQMASDIMAILECEDSHNETPLSAAAIGGNEIVITQLLEYKAQMSIKVVKSAARNGRNGVEVIALLLDRRGDEVSITEEVVKAAAGNGRNGMEVMALLLDRRGDEVSITEEVVKAAAKNYWNAREVMALLLDRRGDEVPVTEEVVKAAAGNGNGKEVMALLLDRRGDEVPVTEEVVKAAAGNGNGKEVMALLLDRRGDEVSITEKVLFLALE